MFPIFVASPTITLSTSPGLDLDIDALSGICGSISIACWIVVFSPQIIENFRRSSADALSIRFLIIWLLGDVFNILGAVLQGVIPTMTILAVYYTLADVVLLGQCFFYRGFTLSDSPIAKGIPTIEEAAVDEENPAEESPLLPHQTPQSTPARPSIADADPSAKRASFSSIHSLLSTNVDGTHLSPATPLISPPTSTNMPPAATTLKSTSTFSAFLLNSGALFLVCTAGVLGWWLSARYSQTHYSHGHEGHHTDSTTDPSAPVHFDVLGQIFGYICAALYLGSRVPQLLLNYRRKSVEGISMLFFLFACVGNLTYVMSIFAYEPACAKIGSVGESGSSGWCEEGEWKSQYGRYVLVNASWLIGSAGTLFLDFMVFVQFWMYRQKYPQMG